MRSTAGCVRVCVRVSVCVTDSKLIRCVCRAQVSKVPSPNTIPLTKVFCEEHESSKFIVGGSTSRKAAAKHETTIHVSEENLETSWPTAAGAT